MKRIRVAALIEMDDGYALMHRKNVKQKENSNQPYGEYYVFPGGGLEDDETLKQGVVREVLEEFGIVVEPLEQIAYKKINEDYEEYLFKCKYVSGKFGTGNGPEFSENPKYIDRGEYIPEIVSKTNIKMIRLIPDEFKEILLKEI